MKLIPALRAFARTFYRNSNDVDDLVQETLLRALRSSGTFDPDTRLKSWLFTIMRNTFYTRAKLYAREAPGVADCIQSRASIEANQEWTIGSREVCDAISRLPDHHRQVLVLIGVLGVSYEETAEICGCALGTVKSRLNRARLRVLQDLGESSASGLLDRGRKQESGRFRMDLRHPQ